MKKITKVMAVATMVSIMFTSTASAVKMYSPDGRTVSVMEEDVESWKAKGWHTKNYQTMYSSDGRSERVLLQDVENWKKNGWYLITDSKKMYSADGKIEEVLMKDVEAWKKVGWYDYPVATVYSADEKTKVIAKSEVDAWKKVGWYDYPVVTVYSTDGKTEIIAKTDVASWKKVGWYENKISAKLGFSADDSFYENLTNTILEEAKYDELIEDLSLVRFNVGYVNNDNIPDIFFAGGKGTGNGVGIFIVKNGKAQKVTYEDEDAFWTDCMFGQSGKMEYIPKKNRIFAEYGGSAWIPTFFDIKNYRGVELIDLAWWHNYYYVGDKSISSLDFHNAFDSYYNDGVEYEKVDYRNMHPLSKENMKKYYNRLVETTDWDKIRMYSSDGKTADVKKSDVESWKKVGWYDEPVRTMYTMDGKSKVISAKDIAAWVKVGWHTRNSMKLYKPDGQTSTALLTDVASWKKQGWYEYPVVKVYSLDGKSEVIAEEELEEWRNVGWYADGETKTLYAADGRSEEVPIKDVVSWKKVGWYEVPVTVLYALDGRTQIVAEDDVYDWLNVGWYRATDYVEMHATNGRTLRVQASYVQYYKSIGWSLTRQKSIDAIKREAWNYVIEDIKERLYVPGSGQFPAYDASNVYYYSYDNTFYVYLKYSAQNRFGIQVRSYKKFEVELNSYGYDIIDEVDLWD